MPVKQTGIFNNYKKLFPQQLLRSGFRKFNFFFIG